MKLLINASGEVQLVPDGVQLAVGAGDELRDATAPELTLIAAGGRLRVIGGELVEVLPEVPEEIALWRAKAVATRTTHGDTNLRVAIETVLEALPGDIGIDARASWHEGNVLVRNSPNLSAVAAILNLTSEQLDTFFRQAAAIPG